MRQKTEVKNTWRKTWQRLKIYDAGEVQGEPLDVLGERLSKDITTEPITQDHHIYVCVQKNRARRRHFQAGCSKCWHDTCCEDIE